jgi:hypothetical protein
LCSANETFPIEPPDGLRSFSAEQGDKRISIMPQTSGSTTLFKGNNAENGPNAVGNSKLKHLFQVVQNFQDVP